ncbi:Pre-mRNA splicing factor PRP21 like protein-domain-containing protein [Umbelopsis sp. PMI_123]|nr:Pre-mRNA splicing factor PRP21 like protein-domain-containing protein [Umbelopsis sp. PMI_123]
MVATTVADPSNSLNNDFDRMDVDQNGVRDVEQEESIKGIIYPPPEVRKIVDKTADFVARKGPTLEDRIRENERHNPRFCFLNPNDPYHAYYQLRITQTKEGKTTKPGVKQDEEEKPKTEEVQEAPKEPSKFEFSSDMPAMSAQDLDIIKHTAQFVARNGSRFMSQLAQRESRNYQFDFLRPSHSLFNYFTSLVTQYTQLLVPPKDIKDQLRKNVLKKYDVLDRVKSRVEWIAWVEAERKKQQDADEKERAAYASIDWHDFVIVETVEFTQDDEKLNLPPPMSLSELENMSLEQKRLAAMAESNQQLEETQAANDEMEIEEVDMQDDEEEEMPQQAVVQDIRIADITGPIKIRTDYKPKVGSTTRQLNEQTGICPRCGQAIPMSEMDEHMRIELLDSKWKEQRQAAEAKLRDSNLLQEGTDVAKILKNFSGYRSDIFGSEETQIGKKVGSEIEAAKEKEKVVWDGHTASINLASQRAAQGATIEEQIAAIHRAKGLTTDSASNIGPQATAKSDVQQQQQQQQQQLPPAGMTGASISREPQPPTSNFQSAPLPPQGYSQYPPLPPQGVPNSGLFANQIPGYGMPPAGVSPVPPQAGNSFEGGITRKADEESADVPRAKKPRTEGTPIAEEEWLAQHPDPIALSIQTPTLPEYKLSGETITIDDLPLTTLVSTLKNRIADKVGMPYGKQKLSVGGVGTVMNNSKSLAFYNFQQGSTVILGLKDKGKK